MLLGVTGALTDPISGIFDSVSYTFEGFKNQIHYKK